MPIRIILRMRNWYKMINLKITDVRALPGDAAFLIDDGKTSILYDTGFAFTGYSVADNIKKELGKRELDYIFLTHSHYDHALGSAYVLQRYPNARVVAGEYAGNIFAKPTARAKMRELDGKFAKECGVLDYEDLIDNLRVDIAVCDGEVLKCGDMEFTVIALPGHTKCSVGFYLEENKLLLGCETLGVYFGNNTFVPSYLTGFQMTLDSFSKAKKLDIDGILLPHYGFVDKEEAKTYLESSEKVALETAEKIKELLVSGASKEQAMAYFEETFYKDNVKPAYPIDAFRLNTSIMIELIEKELVEKQ